MASPEPVLITLEALHGGRPLELTWDRAVADSIVAGEPNARHSPWRIEGDIDWERAEALRLISATFDDGRAFAIAALRPRDATGHDEDSLGHYLANADGEVGLSDALWSTEYDADGLPRRVGLELWAEPEAAPLRIAADREGEVVTDDDGFRRAVSAMSFRLEGAEGTGAFELVRPA